MSTIEDNTGVEKDVEVAGLAWTQEKFSSYITYRAEGFRVTQSFNRLWWLFVANADGEFDTKSKRPEVFSTAKEAQIFAALMAAAREAAA